MRKIYLGLSALLFLVTALSAQQGDTKVGKSDWQLHPNPQATRAFLYEFSMDTMPYVDLVDSISINAGSFWDDPEYVIPLDFPFYYMGEEIDFLVMGDFGGLLFGYSNDAGSNQAAVFAPFNTDLIDRGMENGPSLSPLSYKVMGTPGDQIMIIEFKNAGSYGESEDAGTTTMYISFQMWLYENDNVIAFHYGPRMIDNPSSFYSGETGAIIGLAAIDLNNFDAYNINILEGNANAPSLAEAINTISGTPALGVRYLFTPLSSSTTNPPADFLLAVSPNPTREALTITTDENLLNVTIMSLTGTAVWTSAAVVSGQSIAVDHLSAGMYLLQVSTARGTKVMKWIKE